MMTVIRAGEIPVHTRLIPLDLTDHLDEARRLVEDARREADRILTEARAEVERVRLETRESGFEEGLRAGERVGREAGFEAARKEASAEFEREHLDLIADMRRVVSELDAMKADMEIETRAGLLRFAVALAKKLTFAIGSLHTESAVANLNRALEVLGARLDVTVRAHPRDVAALRTFAAGVMEHVDDSRTMRFVEDESVAPGGCVVAGGCTEVDATLEAQVEEMVALLLGHGQVAPGPAENGE